ncbi:MAG TPA: FHA domain-containing protein [Oculatellaceae cyanobacterium]
MVSSFTSGLVHKAKATDSREGAQWGAQCETEEAPKLLACLVNLSKGKIHTLSEDGVAVIGRSSSCEIILNDDATVSRRHASISMIGTEFYLHDLGSRNGTVVNGELVQNNRIKLNPEDTVQIGKTTYAFSPVGITEALYGSPIKDVTLRSRVSLATKAARSLLGDIFKPVTKSDSLTLDAIPVRK